jgi:hypothetical protein
MLTFKSLREELKSVKWTSTVGDIIFNDYRNEHGNLGIMVPMTQKLTSGFKEEITALHVTSIDGFEKLSKIEKNKNTQISATTTFDRMVFTYGTHHRGVACIVRGTSHFEYSEDLMSIPDRSGMRWIPLERLKEVLGGGSLLDSISYAIYKTFFHRFVLDCKKYIESLSDKEINEFFSFLFELHQRNGWTASYKLETITNLYKIPEMLSPKQKIDKFFENLRPGGENVSIYATALYSIMKNIDKKFIENYIKIYVTMANKVMNKYQDAFNKQYATRYIKTDGRMAEVILSNFEVVRIYLTPHPRDVGIMGNKLIPSSQLRFNAALASLSNKNIDVYGPTTDNETLTALYKDALEYVKKENNRM